MNRRIARQRGTTLIIALIMLVLLTLFALSAMNTATTQLRVVGNMQARAEATNAAQEAIETVMSSTQFIVNPANAVAVPCGAANTICADVTGDGTPDYTTTLTPQPACVKVKPIKNSDLNMSVDEDIGCSLGQQQQFGVLGAVTGDSLCANSTWEITARTVSSSTTTTVNVTQGVAVRIATADASSC